MLVASKLTFENVNTVYNTWLIAYFAPLLTILVYQVGFSSLYDLDRVVMRP